MATKFALHEHLQHNDLAAHIQPISPHGEARQPVRILTERHVIKIDPVVFLEIRVERNAQQPVLDLHGSGNPARHDRRLGSRVPYLHRAVPFDPEHATVRRHLKLHGVRRIAVEHDLLVGPLQRSPDVPVYAARRPQHGLEQVLAEERLLVAFRSMAAAGIQRPPPIVFVRPCDGMVVAHLAAFVTLFHKGRQYMHLAARVRLVVVPFVRAGPARGQVRRGGKSPVEHGDIRFLNMRMALEIRADQLAIPGPFVFGVRRRVYADISAALLDVALEGRLLVVIQHIAGRIQKHHRAVARQIRPGEGRSVLRMLDGESVFVADFP